MRCLLAVLASVTMTVPAFAQVERRPTEPPIVTAENDSWYRLAEPLVLDGTVYVPDGPIAFFNGNTMVRTGHYNGVPVYADTTLPPFSVVFVPIGRGLMHPYERAQAGDPRLRNDVRAALLPPPSGVPRAVVMAPGPPTSPPQPIGAISVFTPERGAVGTSARASAPSAVGTGGVLTRDRQAPRQTITLPPAVSSDGVWLRYMGGTWVSAGPAVPLRASDFLIVGEYAGFPVFARKSLNEERIYLPSVPGMVAPFRLKGDRQ